MRVYITANSPGELAGWVRPVVKHIIERRPDAEIVVVTVPCQYASGRESEYARSIPGVSRVVALGELMRNARSMRCAESCVLFLGGDPMYAVLASRVLRSPAIAYTSKPRWKRRFTRYLVPDDGARELTLKRGVSADRIRVVGHLAVDSIEIAHSPEQTRQRLGMVDDGLGVVTFLPGSRPAEYTLAVPYLLQTAERLTDLVPGVHACMALSPFADRDVVRRLIGELGAAIESESAGVTRVRLPNDSIVAIEWEWPHELMSISDLAVTLPGTCTLQLAVLRVPMIVFVATQYADQVPVDGLLGLVSERFRAFRALKKVLLRRAARRGVVVALPNIITRKNIVSELILDLRPTELAEHAASLLNDRTSRDMMAVDLGKMAVDAGAAARIADEAIELAAESSAGVLGSPRRCL